MKTRPGFHGPQRPWVQDCPGSRAALLRVAALQSEFSFVLLCALSSVSTCPNRDRAFLQQPLLQWHHATSSRPGLAIPSRSNNMMFGTTCRGY